MKNFQQIDLKLSPGKLNISKKTIFNQKEINENEDVDYDSDSTCSSSSGSIHLIVDEASTILEPDGQLSNLSKEKTIDSNEIKNLKSELTDKETLSDSNFNTTDNFATDSKDNNSSSTRFFFSNKNLSEVNMEAENKILKNDQKMDKKWSLSKAEFNGEQVTFFITKFLFFQILILDKLFQIEFSKNNSPSLVDVSNNIKIRINDYIIFSSDKLLNKSINNNEVLNQPKNESKIICAYNELTNESSNTNYSVEEEEAENKETNDSKSSLDDSVCFGQVCSLWNEPVSDLLMVKIKLFLKPEQIQSELDSSERFFEKNELISSNYYFEEFDAENIKKKCLILDEEQYEK